MPGEGCGGLTFADLEEKKSEKTREYLCKLNRFCRRNNFRCIIVVLGDNDFNTKEGMLRPTFNDAMSNPTAVAEQWVATAVALAKELRISNVLLTMLHARLDWDNEVADWRCRKFNSR